MPDIATPLFLKQLRFWSLHCTVNAAPSFLMAAVFLELWQRPGALGAMLSAIITFILLYTTLSSVPGPLRDPHSPFSLAVKTGTRIRMAISVVSLFLIPSGLFMASPDFWCGWLAMGMVNAAGREFFGTGEFMTLQKNSPTGIYLTTLLEGFLLSTMLLMISFFTLLFGQMRRRRKPRATGFPEG